MPVASGYRARDLAMKHVLTLVFFILLTLATTQAGERITVGATTRTYELYGATAGGPRPLILALHGNLMSGAKFERTGAWATFSAKHRVAVALPDGLNTAWADGRATAEIKGRSPPAGTDDVGFLTALVERLVTTGVADPKRIYVAGASNGGMMTYRLLCERPDMFAAGAASIAVLTDSVAARCKPSKPMPILILNCTADGITPWARSGTYMGTEATLAHFRRANRCSDTAETETLPDLEPSDRSTVTRVSYDCPRGADVALLRINGGGHQWPSRLSPPRFEMFLGPRNRDIEGADEVWAFFQRFSR
jgi:polyhydroxybutyrate depolymerase